MSKKENVLVLGSIAIASLILTLIYHIAHSLVYFKTIFTLVQEQILFSVFVFILMFGFGIYINYRR